MRVPHPIPYQGSKRGLAHAILACLPPSVERLIEPFAGSAAVSLAAASAGQAAAFVLNDLHAPLMQLWAAIIEQPHDLADQYEQLWHAQQGQERAFYNHVRDQFNRTQQPAHLLYLLARCVKAAVRYNAHGHFNQSPDHRRKGTHPATLRRQIVATAQLLARRTTLTTGDYRAALGVARTTDLVYLDPPYQGVRHGQDRRYVRGLAEDEFVAALAQLNARAIPFIVSYDGRTGAKTFGPPLPDRLNLARIELAAGRSSQATLLGRADHTYEALYLSPALLAWLEQTGAAVSSLTERLALERAGEGATAPVAKGAGSAVRDCG